MVNFRSKQSDCKVEVNVRGIPPAKASNPMTTNSTMEKPCLIPQLLDTFSVVGAIFGVATLFLA